jgi:HicA toxin of bacterial toxin-antitoxin,
LSKLEKLKARLQERPTNFAFRDLETLLIGLGYKVHQGGHSSGSRVHFVHEKLNHSILLHKPHPRPEQKRYQVKYILEALKSKNLL